jgi:hypothetical protein
MKRVRTRFYSAILTEKKQEIPVKAFITGNILNIQLDITSLTCMSACCSSSSTKTKLSVLSNYKPIPKIQPKNNQYLPLAKRLEHIIRTKRKTKYNPQKFISWSKNIRLLSETEGIEYDRIKKALDWYADNIDKPFVPVIFSGSSLRLKFFQLEDAIERQTKPNHILHPSKFWDNIEYEYCEDGKYRNAGGDVWTD